MSLAGPPALNPGSSSPWIQHARDQRRSWNFAQHCCRRSPSAVADWLAMYEGSRSWLLGNSYGQFVLLMIIGIGYLERI